MAFRRIASIDDLHKLLDYDPATGPFTWKAREPGFYVAARACKRWNERYAGTRAGYFDGHGYICLKIADRSYLAHRIAWAMSYGAWPQIIDHKNGRPADNRICNLRSVSRAINQRNQRQHRTNTSGKAGVYWWPAVGKWAAQIKMHNKTHHLGTFLKKSDAIAARRLAERQNGFTGRGN